jgi:ubiquitin C-terminal hydrolase
VNYFYCSFLVGHFISTKMTLKSQLSNLMPVAEACGILGEDRVARIVMSILKSQQNNRQAFKRATFSKQQLATLEEALHDETSALVHSMLYTTNAVKPNKKVNHVDSQAVFLEDAMKIKPNAPLSDSSHMVEPSFEEQIPPPIRACWKKLNSRALLLDKDTLLKFLVPASAQPHGGPGGHQGLFDCLTFALQTKASSATPASSAMGGLSPPPLVSIPDICIFLAVCHRYWLLHSEDNPEKIVSFDGDHPTVTVMAQWMFLVFDAYQKKGMIVRDTIHRFMSDIYGEDSYKGPPIVEVLDAIFKNPNSPLTSREFVRGVVDTLSYTPLPSHFLLDWMAALAQAMMPLDITSSSTLLPESAESFLQTMDQQRRWLPQICDQYHLAEHRLYEIKRRFHSLVESSTTVIQGDPMGDAVEEAPRSSNRGNNSGNSSNSLPSISNAKNALPKHVIPAAVFYQKVCYPNDEMGNGGFLPHAIAERVFQSVANFSSPTPVDDIETEEEAEISKTSKARSYWDLAHVLQYSGMCVRADDDDEALLKWILQLFCKRGDTFLSRSQVELLLVCLCDHKDFRNKTDRPRWEQEEDDTEVHSNDEVDNDEDQDGLTVVLQTALQLRLLPDSYAQTEAQTPRVAAKVLVDHMLKTVKSKDGILTKDQFLAWHRNTKVFDEHRLGPLIMDLRLIASVLFGVPPRYASMEKRIIMEIQERHRRRYPQTDVSRRGPRGTVWYIIDDKWYKTWSQVIDKLSQSSEDGQDLRDKASENASPRRVTQISNKSLLKDNGSLALRVDIKWRHDYEIIPPLAWSALSAWYDGGPPIHRVVVPYSSSASNSSVPSRGRGPTMRTENEIELYPFFVTMFLCDSASRGEARPFQQQVPVSRVNPVRVLLVQLCKGLEIDPDMGRLWVVDTSDPEQSGKNDWILNLDLNIVDQRKNRVNVDGSGSGNISLLLELKDGETGLWPRGSDGTAWTFKKDEFDGMDVGDGIVGLYNMGNTCYLNSSIQCLSHTPIFREYFTSKCYLNDINTANPVGYGGHLAQVTAVLINSLWRRFNQQMMHQPKRVTAPGSYAPVNCPALTPKTFKESIGKFDDRFSGNEQHDAQELLTFLLDGLSEELNRIKDKPFIENPDSDGRPDSELADIWWSNLLKREMSIIIAMFHGQYKSLLRCKSCKYESARFENFSCLTLPLPEDENIPVSLIYYPSRTGADITKYSVNVHNNGTLYDVLIALAKILFQDEVEENQDTEDLDGLQRGPGLQEPESEAEKERLRDLYAKMASNMAVVDMRDGFIFKIAPNAWRLPDLQNKETGELPTLHIYGLDPLPELDEPKVSDKEEDFDKEADYGEVPGHPSVRSSFLAFAQRRSELVSKDFLHPLTHRVFGTPMLLRVANLDDLTGSQVYDLVAEHLQSVVPQGALKFLTSAVEPAEEYGESEDMPIKKDDGDREKTKDDIRGTLTKTLSDAEEVSAGPVPRYGFRLRLASREGRRCALCPWYDCCIGCLVPDDGKPTVVSNGDSIAVDWHFAVDVATSGFGTRAGQDPSAPGTSSRGHVPGVRIKNHNSCGNGSKKKGQSKTITLEDCLDEFAKEEKIPEVYCSKCKDYKIQMKRMSLWRLPPVVIIHLKRFQFTQHMRRKLRDFVEFPIEGLDLSRIMARDSPVSKPKFSEALPKEGKDPHIHDETEGPDSEKMNRDKKNVESSTQMNHDDGRSEMLYDLYGVVHHQGALSAGHYVASLKSDVDGQWRLFNDAQVYEIHSRDVVDSSAYLLFYIRRDVAGQKLTDMWDVSKRDGSGITEEEMDYLIKGRSDKCVIS